MAPIPTFAPASHQAHALTTLFIGVLIVLCAIFLLVTGLVSFMIVRYRDRPGAPEARQIFGWTTLEVVWTLIPLGILAVLSVFMMLADHVADPPIPEGRKPDLRVIAHQWWWEINYLASGVVAANEIHIPIGKPILIELHPFIFLAPAFGFLVLIVVPFFNRGERHPARRPWAVAAVITIVMMILSLWIEAKRAPWSPDFSAKLLPASVIASTQPEVTRGAALFHAKGCEFCHEVEGFGGHRGPNLSDVGDRLTHADIVIRILNGGNNMPAFARAR